MTSSNTATGSGRSLTLNMRSRRQGFTAPPQPTTSTAGSPTTTSERGWRPRSTPSTQQPTRPTRSRDPGWLTAELLFGLPIRSKRMVGILGRGWSSPASGCHIPTRSRSPSHSRRNPTTPAASPCRAKRRFAANRVSRATSSLGR
ncbi:MAG: hypothetical protein J07HQW1_01318 [Haloquadratum walsbyi J07HQW1]|uniref:Uncharacterized protein n=1 Tax=Haloquadratum walsbyi J07HQW1 TaxID=1238424 RepID=U1MN86_9EURY|nr:MAG: hypothetical protein J07HQW1_01318 [Haloquadratum walsbyi J07HQW1]